MNTGFTGDTNKPLKEQSSCSALSAHKFMMTCQVLCSQLVSTSRKWPKINHYCRFKDESEERLSQGKAVLCSACKTWRKWTGDLRNWWRGRKKGMGGGILCNVLRSLVIPPFDIWWQQSAKKQLPVIKIQESSALQVIFLLLSSLVKCLKPLTRASSPDGCGWIWSHTHQWCHGALEYTCASLQQGEKAKSLNHWRSGKVLSGYVTL